MPGGFRFHDLRHYYASMLMAPGADVKAVQARLRHASAKTTLDTYAHLMPDSDAKTNVAIEDVANIEIVTTLIDGVALPSSATERRRSATYRDQMS